MTERERLIELVKDYHCYPEKTCQNLKSNDNCANCEYDEMGICDCFAKEADYLLANDVIVPLCKVGDRVYRIVEMSTGIRHKINRFHQGQFNVGTIKPCDPTIKRFIRCVTVTRNNIYDCCEKFGKTVFPTKEEAEKALEEMEE